MHWSQNILSYSEVSKIFQGFAPEPHREGLTALPRLPSCTVVFLLTTLAKKLDPPPKKKKKKKLLDMALIFSIFLRNMLCFKVSKAFIKSSNTPQDYFSL